MIVKQIKETPTIKGEKKTVANLQLICFMKIHTYTSDEVLFKGFAIRNEVDKKWDDRSKESIIFPKVNHVFALHL